MSRAPATRMMKPSLQLRIGQQLTMTPQLLQAIRLLQLPALELQAQLREALESNVMLEQDEESENTLSLEDLAGLVREDEDEDAPDLRTEPTVEIGVQWPEATAARSEAPWSGGDDDRIMRLPDESGQTLTDHLLWQLELAHLDARSLMIGRAIVDAINGDGYLSDTPEDIAAPLRPEVEAGLGLKAMLPNNNSNNKNAGTFSLSSLWMYNKIKALLTTLWVIGLPLLWKIIVIIL